MEQETLTRRGASRLEVKSAQGNVATESPADEVVRGLSAKPKSLPPKYFYDEAGSRIFEEICDLPEYYLTRAETEILTLHASEIAGLFDAEIALVEFGSGSAVKTRLIIEAFLQRHEQLHYVPIDISRTALLQSAQLLVQDYPALRITAWASEYDTALETLQKEILGDKLVLFLGSNIGNFERNQAGSFLRKIRSTMGETDGFLIGIDLAKDRGILEPAYDDRQGVTAGFNLNILKRMNREFEGDFELSQFRHKACFNEDKGRIEMHLASLVSQDVHLKKLHRTFHFEAGETIHTENSYKYSPDQIKSLAVQNGFELERSWFDSRRWFSLNLLRPIG